MRGGKTLPALLAAAALSLGAGLALASTPASKATEASKPGAAQAEKRPEIHRVRGEVTAVEPDSKTMLLKAMQGKQELTVGVNITDKTIIREGKAHKTLADLKAGDRVWMKYERTNGKLVANVVRILKPTSTAAKSTSY